RRVFLGERAHADGLAEVAQWMGGYCPAAAHKYFWQLDEENPRDFFRWDGLRYLLYEWELHRLGDREVKVEWKVLHDRGPKTTIEHVLPQTPTDAYWTERFDEPARVLYTNDLGNLALTKDNSSYGNRAFPRKRGE